ncbi:MAG: PIN domain-containing protein [Dehalococcoidia bacterium]
MRFVDTNVLLYAVSGEPAEDRKREVARFILGQRDLAFSAQVLQEFYVQSTRPGRSRPLTHQEATDYVLVFARFTVQPITVALVSAAKATGRRFGVSYWDAAIIEGARLMDCAEVLSEDLQHGQDSDGVVVVDPFR